MDLFVFVSGWERCGPSRASLFVGTRDNALTWPSLGEGTEIADFKPRLLISLLKAGTPVNVSLSSSDPIKPGDTQAWARGGPVPQPSSIAHRISAESCRRDSLLRTPGQ